MKAKFIMLLHLFGLDVLLLGLVERFLNALSKKLGEWKIAGEASLARCGHCNGELTGE